MKIIECKEIITEKRNRIEEIVNLAKTEIRDLSEDEQKEIDDLKQEIEDKKEEIKELQDELDKQVPKEDEEETKACDDEEKEENKRNLNKYISKNKMKQNKFSLVKEIRNALAENKKSITVNAEKRTMTVTGENGVHDEVIETEIEGILSPLYANSVLTSLGARWYTGIPKGDVQIPLMNANTVGWEGEIDEAPSTGNSFNTVKLTPHRLTAIVSLSKVLLAQDTIGVEAAVRADIVKALNAKLEATVFGDEAGTAERPAGLFYGVTPTEVETFKDVCDLESSVEENNVYGNMQYVLSPAAKAYFRSTIKGTNNTGMIYEAGEMDGIPSKVTTNVAKYDYIYGDFSNLVVGSWGDLEIVLDPYTEASKGCIRLIVTGLFDFKAVKKYNAQTNTQVDAFAFGAVKHE